MGANSILNHTSPTLNQVLRPDHGVNIFLQLAPLQPRAGIPRFLLHALDLFRGDVFIFVYLLLEQLVVHGKSIPGVSEVKLLWNIRVPFGNHFSPR